MAIDSLFNLIYILSCALAWDTLMWRFIPWLRPLLPAAYEIFCSRFSVFHTWTVCGLKPWWQWV